jgi:Tat protein secretion system quality control protein TatD with DNase activity
MCSAGHPSIVLQKAAFFEQLQLSKETNIPVMIVSRNNFVDTLDLLLNVLLLIP